MSETIEGAGVPLAVTTSGTGPTVLLVHDLAADARSWGPLAAELDPAEARTIAYDRRGYGASGAPDPYERTTVQEQSEDARALLEAIGGEGPALAIGAGFGALIVLDLLVRLPQLLRGAVLIAPPLHQFSPSATSVLSQQRALLEVALREGGPAAAVEMWNPAADEAIRAAHRAFFADFAGLTSWPVARSALRGVAVPVAILTPSETPPHLLESAAALAGLLPHASRPADETPLPALRALL